MSSTRCPGYARPTHASISRSIHEAKKGAETYVRKNVAKKANKLCHYSNLNREPSGCPSSRSWTIQAADLAKSCPIAKLPTELRQIIYQYVLPDAGVYIVSRGLGSSYLWPALLRICHVIRHEAAYVFYTRTEFCATIYSLDFSSIKHWPAQLPIAHREFLARNQRLTLTLRIDASDYFNTTNFTEHRQGLPYGNLYNYKGQHTQHFISLCKLSDWFLWCNSPKYNALQWKYDLVQSVYKWDRWMRERTLLEFLKHRIGVFALPCVQNALLHAEHKSRMKKEAMNMLDELEEKFGGLSEQKKRQDEVQWEERMSILRQFFGRW